MGWRAWISGGTHGRAAAGLGTGAAMLALMSVGGGSAVAASSQQVAVDPDGNAQFVWVRSDGTHPLVEERRRSALGPFSDAQYVSPTGGWADAPRVAVDPHGNATLVWLRFNGSHWIVQTRTRSAAGALSAVQDLSASGQDASGPQVAVDANGNATFVWYRFDGTNHIVQTRGRTAAGALSATRNLSASGQSALGPQLGVDRNGNTTFVWYRWNPDHAIVQTRSRSAAGGLSAVQNLSADGQSAWNPQVAVDPDGDATFAWDRTTIVNGSFSSSVQTRSRSAAGALSAVQNLSVKGERADGQQVATDSDGNATFVWSRVNSNGNAIVRTRRRTAAGSLSEIQNLSANGPDAPRPQVALDPGGNATFVWQLAEEEVVVIDGFETTRTNYTVQTRSRSAAGAVSTTRNLSADNLSTTNPQVAVGADGAATFLWFENGPKTRKRTADGGLTGVRDLSEG